MHAVVAPLACKQICLPVLRCFDAASLGIGRIRAYPRNHSNVRTSLQSAPLWLVKWHPRQVPAAFSSSFQLQLGLPGFTSCLSGLPVYIHVCLWGVHAQAESCGRTSQLIYQHFAAQVQQPIIPNRSSTRLEGRGAALAAALFAIPDPRTPYPIRAPTTRTAFAAYLHHQCKTSAAAAAMLAPSHHLPLRPRLDTCLLALDLLLSPPEMLSGAPAGSPAGAGLPAEVAHAVEALRDDNNNAVGAEVMAACALTWGRFVHAQLPVWPAVCAHMLGVAPTDAAYTHGA